MPRPPDDTINEHTRRWTYFGEGVYLVGMGAGGWGAALKANLIVEFFSESPLKNMMDGNLVMPRPPDDIIKKTSVPNVGLTLGKGCIASEWAPEDGGQR